MTRQNLLNLRMKKTLLNYQRKLSAIATTLAMGWLYETIDDQKLFTKYKKLMRRIAILQAMTHVNRRAKRKEMRRDEF